MKLTAEQRLQKAHVTLMRTKEFCMLSGIMMCGSSKVVEDCPTAATNGWDVKYGRAFIEGLDDKEFTFVVAHENFHKMLKQISLWQKLYKEDGSCANRAADYVINLMITDLDPNEHVLKMPGGERKGLLDERFRGMNTQGVYNVLRAEKAKEKDKNEGEVLDDHEWGDAQSLSPAEAQEREKAIDAAIRQGVQLAGRMAGDVQRGLNEVLEPKINWREALRDFVTSVCSGRDMTTWRRPSRRHLHEGVYMPSMYSESMGDIVIAIDTSGSVGESELAEFVAELVGICDQVAPAKVHLLWWDTSVAGHQEFEAGGYDAMRNSLEMAGGGGTDVSVVFDYVAANRLQPECCVILTDGYTPWCSAPHYPVLFGMTSDIIAPFGTSLRIS